MSMQILTPGLTITEFENLLSDTIKEKLGSDKEALKALEVTQYIPQDTQEILAMGNHPGLLDVKGFLALNDSGEGRAFSFRIEAGLPVEQDKEIAVECAVQAQKCVSDMKRAGGYR